MSTIVTTIDPERQMLGDVEMVGRERWEEIHRRGELRCLDPSGRWRVGSRSQDGAAGAAADGVDAVRAGGAFGHAGVHARGVSAAAGGRCRLLRSRAVSGAAPTAVHRQLRDGETVRAADPAVSPRFRSIRIPSRQRVFHPALDGVSAAHTAHRHHRCRSRSTTTGTGKNG